MASGRYRSGGWWYLRHYMTDCRLTHLILALHYPIRFFFWAHDNGLSEMVFSSDQLAEMAYSISNKRHHVISMMWTYGPGLMISMALQHMAVDSPIPVARPTSYSNLVSGYYPVISSHTPSIRSVYVGNSTFLEQKSEMMMTGPEKTEGGSIHRPPITRPGYVFRRKAVNQVVEMKGGGGSRWRPTDRSSSNHPFTSHYDPLVIPVYDFLNSYQSWHGYQVDAQM